MIDRELALSTFSSTNISSAVSVMVLQEGIGIHDVRSPCSAQPPSWTSIHNSIARHRKKREAKIKREVKRGIREPNEQNPFEIFVTVTDIRYT